MLFVDRDLEIHRKLQVFIPANLQESTPWDAASGCDSFSRELGGALSGGAGLPRWTAEHPSGLTGGFWSSFHLVNRAAVSQYDILRRVISDQQGLPGHVVCLALSGDDFHGQQGRSWAAEKGNLHLSLGLKCDLPAADCGRALTMLPAVAVMDALADMGGCGRGPGRSGIKWVNDILIDGRKLGGVLTSARSVEGRLESAVLGIGLNVSVAPAIEPTPFTPGATCLENHVRMPADSLATVLKAVLEAVAHRFGQLEDLGPEPLLKAYRDASLVLGQEVRVISGQEGTHPRQGRVLAIGADLNLVLSDDPEPVTEGRLILLPEGA